MTQEQSLLKTAGSFLWELIKIFLLAMVIILPIRYFLVQPFFVRGASMEPNFLDGEYLVVDELSYQFREPERGEVIVFRFPGDTSQFFIKRIIGLPRETARIEDGQVIISNKEHPEGVLLNEAEYLPEDLRTGGQVTITLGDNEYFVLGDNRSASSDSRSWGPLTEEAIVGRAWLRAFPFERFGVLMHESVGLLNL